MLEPWMETPRENTPKFLIELEPRGRAFWSSVAAALRPVRFSRASETGMWRDVFVRQRMPWGRFFQSAVLHASAVALIWWLSVAWLKQQNILHTPFDRSSLITYSQEEYLPPLDTGSSDVPTEQAGDPAYAKQAILSVPPEADNRTQTIVAPPDLKLTQDVPLPNIVATAAIAPLVPLSATRAPMTRIIAQETSVVAPVPQVESVRDHVVRTSLTSEIVAPPPEVSRDATRNFTGPDAAVVAPPPDLTHATSGRVGQINIGPSAVVAPAPQLAVAPQHSLTARGMGGMPGTGEPVAPPPSVGAAGGSSAGGRLIALGIHPVAPTGPVPVPGGNRRGTFAAGPDGRPGGAGTPRLTGSDAAAKGSGSKGNGGGDGAGGKTNSALPPGLHVGAANSNAVGPIQKNGTGSGGDGGAGEELMAKATPPRVGRSAQPATPIADDKVTETDRQVFGAKRTYSTTVNRPNLNSATGSWVIHFAELKANQPPGELLPPVPMDSSDPGYPLELMRENVHGSVTLYAIIHSDGRVGDIRVLNSPDERLDPFATSALARWKFLPALRSGKPVALEAVVVIPFRARRDF